MGQKDKNFFKIDDHEGGIPRELAAGVTARIFPGAQAMVSVVRLNPNSHTKSHAHPQEQLGVPSVGKRHADSGRRDHPSRAERFLGHSRRGRTQHHCRT